jgi:uncharacterized membrane protein YraQ (UPF0718 family)
MIKEYRIQIILGLVVLLLAGAAYQQGGAEMALQGLTAGVRLLLRELPLLTAAFLTAGLLQVLISKELVTKWLGQEAGLKGILLACLGGGLIPGGPYAYYPIAGALMKSGAGLGVLIAFVTAKNLWSVTRLPLEIAILGFRVTFQRILITLLIPPLIGILAENLFGGQIETIRKQADS